MRIPISELTEKSFVESSYLVKVKNQAIAKNGKPYLNVILMDKTGEIESRVWDDAEELSALFEKGDVIQVRGHINLYQGKKQLIINDLEKVPPSQINVEDFLPVSKRNIEEMFKELLGHIQNIKDPWLKKLASQIFSCPQLAEKFKRSPAAVGVHHVFIGGLLEHTLSLCSLVKAIVLLYPELDEDLLISACLYHDIGKTEELSFQQSFEYTNEGKLLGHIVQGVLLVDKEISKIPNFPNQLKTSVHHMILSHHGEYEFGSPKRPKFLEAIVFHFLDNLDSKIQGVQSFFDKPQPEGSWTGYHKIYDRYFYNGPLGLFSEQKGPEEQHSPAAEKKPISQPMHSSVFDSLSADQREKLQTIIKSEDQPNLF